MKTLFLCDERLHSMGKLKQLCKHKRMPNKKCSFLPTLLVSWAHVKQHLCPLPTANHFSPLLKPQAEDHAVICPFSYKITCMNISAFLQDLPLKSIQTKLRTILHFYITTQTEYYFYYYAMPLLLSQFVSTCDYDDDAISILLWCLCVCSRLVHFICSSKLR